MGLCEGGRHLRDYSANKDEAEDVDCEDEENYESDHCMRRRLGRDEEGEIEKAEGDDCTEEDGCEGHRRLEDDESSDENEREEEHNGDVQADDGAKRLLRAAIQN